MRKVIIVNQEGEKILTNGGWLRLAPPTGKESQWVSLHSASELADYFLRYRPDLPPELDRYLDSIRVKSKKLLAIAECKTPLNIDSKGNPAFGEKGPRNHDLLLIGRDVVIGLEAKAAEPLDEVVTEKGDKPKLSKNQIKRYPGLCKQILDLDIEECSKIRYQLLSATAGTLIEAEKHNVDKAVLLIVLFESEISKNAIKESVKDIKLFKKYLKNKNYDKKTGAYRVKYKPNIKFYVEYKIIKVSSYNK